MQKDDIIKLCNKTKEKTVLFLENTERMMTMYTFKNVMGHIQVYDQKGNFLFSADNEREAREELEEYAESAA